MKNFIDKIEGVDVVSFIFSIFITLSIYTPFDGRGNTWVDLTLLLVFVLLNILGVYFKKEKYKDTKARKLRELNDKYPR
ncbi:MAG: hypothetical protein Q4A67_01630 [Aerococcus sp.]|nr:hypothetical protein [Aerococcus sp.]